MAGTDLISLAVYPLPSELRFRDEDGGVPRPVFGNFRIDRHYHRLQRSMVGFPDVRACVVITWRGGRVPLGIRIGGKPISSLQRGWVMAGGTYIGVYDRIVDGGDDDGGEHEMLIVVTNPDCVRRLRSENQVAGLLKGAEAVTGPPGRR